MVGSLILIGAEAGVRTGEKKPGAGQKRTGSATLIIGYWLEYKDVCSHCLLVVYAEVGQVE